MKFFNLVLPHQIVALLDTKKVHQLQADKAIITYEKLNWDLSFNYLN